MAWYRLHEAGSVTHEVGPETLEDSSRGGLSLQRVGEPRFVAGGPPGRPAGSLRFGASAYRVAKVPALSGGGLLLEAWVQAESADAPGLHGIVSLGDGARGVTIAQQGRRWVAFVGGRGAFPIAEVRPGEWVHLAIVADGDDLSVWAGGRRAGRFARWTGLHPNFSIGDMGHRREWFTGLIHEVRLSTFAVGAFDPDEDLLIGREEVEKARRADRERIRAVAKPRPGVRVVDDLSPNRSEVDWLVTEVETPARLLVHVDPDGGFADLALDNGLIRRTLRLSENLATTGLRELREGREFVRAVRPEARITVGGKEYPVGGLTGEPVRNLLVPRWLETMRSPPGAFVFRSLETGPIRAEREWRPRWGAPEVAWPPRGLEVTLHFAPPPGDDAVAGLRVAVHYTLYQGAPFLAKRVSFTNRGEAPVEVERLTIEELAVSDEVADQLFVESEYAFFRCVPVRWHVEPEFTTDAGPIFTERMSGYRLRFWSPEHLDRGFRAGGPEWEGEYRSRTLLTVGYPVGPARRLGPGESWSSFRCWEIPHDRFDAERMGLARRQLYRTVFPWVLENPIYMHVLRSDSASIRSAVDQCAEVGFDMAVLTFGSGFDMMSEDPEYLARIRADFDYAHRKGIRIGGYILFSSSRSYGDGRHDVSPPAYGRSLCLGSEFSDVYFERLLRFIEATGADLIETDGPYHGFPCARTDHPHHRGEADSYRVNWERQCGFYRECARRGVYIISPDWYYASGNQKTPMGYKESNWTLPRPLQVLIARQNVYDGTWWRTPTMCYHACPLSSVYGGGPESTVEPLREHLDHYDAMLAQYFGMGIMAAYRGPRLYDAPRTRELVRGWVDFYREHEAVLTRDIIHVRRPDGRDLDCMMHVHPHHDVRALAFIWNPTSRRIRRPFELPLYYTGLADRATVRERGAEPRVHRLDRERRIRVPVDIEANRYTWLTVEPSAGSGSLAPLPR